jgi:hypothetical protein
MAGRKYEFVSEECKADLIQRFQDGESRASLCRRIGTHHRSLVYTLLAPYVVLHKDARRGPALNHPGRKWAKRFTARNHCSECGHPTYNDVDAEGKHHGMVCMNVGAASVSKNGRTEHKYPCVNYLKRCGSCKNEDGDYESN